MLQATFQSRASLSTGITESIFTVILVTFRNENQLLSLLVIQSALNAAVSAKIDSCEMSSGVAISGTIGWQSTQLTVRKNARNQEKERKIGKKKKNLEEKGKTREGSLFCPSRQIRLANATGTETKVTLGRSG